MNETTEAAEAKFSLVIGGPFYRLQQRLGLLGPDMLPPLRTALLFVLVAWLPPAILSLLHGSAWNSALGNQSFFLDFIAYARFIIAILMFTVMEPIAERRIAGLIRQFTGAGLVTAPESGRFQAALQRADRRSSSAPAEFIVLCLAYVASVYGAVLQITVLQTSWLGTLSDGNLSFTLAGWWAILVSLPLFWFLLLRWMWRFIVWTILLRDISRLKLRLVATHPDQSGGIGFLGLFPPTFSALVFALSCVTASIALREIMFAGVSLESMAPHFLVWLIFVELIFIGPLLVFCQPLIRLRERALLEYGRLATMHNRAFEAKWVRPIQVPDEVLGTADISSLADLTAGFETVRSMHAIPDGWNSFIPLLIAAGLPWIAVVLTQVPLLEILSTITQALL